MILAAPIVIPFAKALGLSIGTLGMAKATDMINNYIQENPEQSVKILSTIVPSIGIGQTVMNEEKISLEDLDEMTDEEAQDLSKEEKAELMKQAGKSGSKDKRQTMIDISEKLGLSGENKDKQDIEYEVDERYEGGVEEVSKPKFDYKKFFRKRRSNGGPLNDDEEYQQSEFSKRVNELMDDGFDFGEAVKEAMKEGYKDGGSIGIEVLFGPKVPAAPSQLVEESEIVLGYRGDAGYRSGSAQASSIGQGNVGSQASFGGGKGTDRSGRSEGISGVDRSKVTQEQNINQLKNQLGIKDPNLIQKTFNKYNSLPFGVKSAINTMAPVELMKLFNIGNVINTGVNQMKYPDITEEDVTLGIDNLRADLTKAQQKALGKQKMGYELGLFSIDDVRKNIEPLGDPDKPATNEEIKEFFTAKDGGRVGLFMGGSPLEGEALSIYNSMKAYGNDDQTIADRLQALGMYTPGDSTPTPPGSGDNIIESQINEDRGGITELQKTFTSLPGDPDNFRLSQLEGTSDYFPPTTALGKTKNFFMEKFFQPRVKGTLGDRLLKQSQGITSKIPLPGAMLAYLRSPFNPDSPTYNPLLPEQLNFLEAGTGTRVTGTSDNLKLTEGLNLIGRDPNTGGLKYGPGSVLSGKNVISGFGTNNYEAALNKYLTRMNTYTNPTKFQQQKIEQAKQELKALQEKQAQDMREREASTAARARAANPDVYARADALGFTDGRGGGFASKSTGTNEAFSNKTGRGRQGYGEGGLATMFKRKR